VAIDARDRRLLRLFTACVLGRWDAARALRAEARPPEPDRRWREALLQVHVFAGFPRLVEAYGVLAEAGGLGERGADERTPEGSDAAAAGMALDAERERGRALFDRIYGGDAAAVRALLEGYDADFAAWIEGHAYGRVLARPGLEPAMRELCAVCALAALGQERQLASHARGSLRLGATTDDVAGAIAAVEDLIGAGRAETARRVVARFGRPG